MGSVGGVGGGGLPGAVPGVGGSPGPEDPTVVLPAAIGPYVVMRPLGSGGMGVVSLCRTGSGRLVAVKQVREEYADDPAFRSRFRREVAAARRVGGVYTVPVADADTEGPRPWVASAYVPAPTLAQAVRICGSFQEPALRALGTGLVEALQAIHTAGLVHRDLKPGNVLLAADGPRVIDFGISKALGETRLTHTGTVIGSPAFMAPEQISSLHDVGPAGDIFALAGLIVYAACGEGPFGPGDEGALHRVMTAEPDLAGVPDPLHPLLLRCLDKNPSRRPPLTEVLAALSPADPADLMLPALREDLALRASDAELMAVAPPPPGRTPGDTRKQPRLSRRTALIGGLSLAGALAAGGAVVALRGGGGGGKSTAAKNPGSGKPLGANTRTVELTAPPKPLWTAHGPATPVTPDLRAFGSTVVLRDAAYTAAYDAASGAVRWVHGAQAGGQPAHGKDPFGLQSLVLGITDTDVVVWRQSIDASFSQRSAVERVDPATGRALTKAALPPTQVTPSVLLAAYGSTVYCMVEDFQSNILTMTPGATPSASLTQHAAAIHLSAGAGSGIAWRRPFTLNSQSTLHYAADQDGFYYTQDTSDGLTLHALDSAHGTARWSVKVPADPDSSLPAYAQAGGGELDSSLAVGDGVLVTANIKGGMIGYDTATGRRLWSVPMTAVACPVIVGDVVLANDTSRVYAVDLRTGKVKWKVESPVQLSAYDFFGRTIAASDQVTAVLFNTLSLGTDGTSLTGGTAGCLVLRTSDGKELWALRQKPRPTSAISPSSIGGGVPSTALDMWTVAVGGSTVFLSGEGQVSAYRADA